MAFIAPILSIAGTLLGGVSALGQGLYQAQVAKNNAAIASRNSGLAAEAAQIEAMRSDREYAAQRGQVLASQSASGLDVLGGSQQAVLGLVDRSRAEAATDLRLQGSLQSEDFNNKAAAFKGEANAAKSAGITSLIGSVLKAGGQGFDAFSGGGSGTLKYQRKNYPWRD